MIKRIAIAALVFGACSSGDDDNIVPGFDAGIPADAEVQPDAAPQVPPLEAFCAPGGPFDEVFSGLRECGGFLRSLELNGTDLFTGEGVEAFCLHLYQPMVDDGTLTIDRDALAACSTYATTTSCDEIAGDSFNFNGTPCEDVLVGTVAADGECELSEQCAGDSFCDQGKDECGTCSPRLADEVACAFNDQCINGLCNSQGVCGAPANVGGSCVDSDDCVGFLDCDNTSTCVSLIPSAGDACVTAADCTGPVGFVIPFDIGLFCGAQGTCEPTPAVGDACLPEAVLELGFQIDQGACNILEYEWCDSGTCAAPETSGLGEPCNMFAISDSGARRCESGLICSNPEGGIEGPVGECQAPGYLGESCDEGAKGAPPLEPCSPFFPCVEGICAGSSEYAGICPAS